jgi:hypothetical protein
MADFRRIHVDDTNIWIDLYAGGIIHEVFQLPLRFIAPDVVIAELRVPDGQTLVSLGLQQEELAGDGVHLVIQLASRYPDDLARGPFCPGAGQSKGRCFANR